VQLPRSLKTQGVVLVDQIRTIDRRHRMFDRIETAPDELIAEVLGRLASLFGMNPAISVSRSDDP
jgi:mRNA interferase MazF